MKIYFTYYQEKNSRISNALAKRALKKRLVAVTQANDIEGFTLVSTLGAWQGKTEPSFELLLVGVDTKTGVRVAEQLKEVFEQDSVMIENNNQFSFV